MSEYDEIRNELMFKQDFPSPGVKFLDVAASLTDSYVLQNWKAYVNRICVRTVPMDVPGSYTHVKPSVVFAVDGRGFLFGATAASTISCSLQLLRKQGKLPFEGYTEYFKSEYRSLEALCAS